MNPPYSMELQAFKRRGTSPKRLANLEFEVALFFSVMAWNCEVISTIKSKRSYVNDVEISEIERNKRNAAKGLN